MVNNKLIQTLKKQLSQERSSFTYIKKGKRVALVYPNTYYIGMSNLGFQAIYSIINNHPTFSCERFFLPYAYEINQYKQSKTTLLSLETQSSILDFDIIAFSVSYEIDYINIIEILNICNIPLKQEDRDNTYPLIIGGGVSIFLNPEPIAPIFDILFIGEGEEIIGEFLNYIEGFQIKFTNKDALLEYLSEISGLYIPSRKGKVLQRKVSSLNKYIIKSQITTINCEFKDMFLIEISRGCPYGCRFCASGFIYLPPRYQNEELILNELDKPIKEGKKIGLIGATLYDYPTLDSLCEKILSKGGKISFSSLRLDSLYERRLNYLFKSQQNTITLGIETGSLRLRNVINKKLTDEEIIKNVENIFRNKIVNLKLYLMIGLPTEEIKDIELTINLIKEVQNIMTLYGKKKKSLGKLIISIGNFIPKPSTPFQWCKMNKVEELENKQKIIKDSLKSIGNIKLIFESPKLSYIQTLFSVGDRKVFQFLIDSYSNLPKNPFSSLYQLRDKTDWYVYREKNFYEPLPWDFIDNRIKKSYLISEYQKGINGITTSSCNVGKCLRCGVC